MFVVKPAGFAEFYAADFHPDEVIGVVNDAHLIGLGVAHPDARFVRLHFEAIIAECNAGPPPAV
jgi:hypothetical protein